MKNYLILIPLLLCLPGLATAQNGAPVHIEADRMETDQKQQLVTFFGNVAAKQGDLSIFADTMTVHYREGAAPAAGDSAMEKIIADGNVKIARQNWSASSGHLEYLADSREAVLTGDARVWQDNNMVSGERIQLFLDEGRSVVERKPASKERVKAFFFPGKEKPAPSSVETSKD